MKERRACVLLARHVLSGHMWIAGVECPFNGLATLTLRRILSPFAFRLLTRVPRCLIAVNCWLQDFYPFRRLCSIDADVVYSLWSCRAIMAGQQLTSWQDPLRTRKCLER